VLLGTALLLAGIWVARRSYARRGTAFLGLSFFAITWAPVSGIVPSSTLVADRYLYLPCLGLFVALAGGVAHAWRTASVRKVSLGTIGCTTAILLGAWYLYLTPSRVYCWSDGLTLWTDALRENPRNSFAHNQIAMAHFHSGRYGAAAASSIEAARHGLTDPSFLFNLCVAYRGLGDSGRELEVAQQILSVHPDFVPAWMTVLRHMRESDRHEECRRLLDELDGKYPGNPGLLFARAELEESQGNLEQALRLLLRSVERHSGDPEVLLALAGILQRLGDDSQATSVAALAIEHAGGRLEPGARLRLDQLLLGLQRRGGEESLRQAEKLRQMVR
jgi:tetratricopeptide (TPR) repeat protein